jgi:hypothetical protein
MTREEFLTYAKGCSYLHQTKEEPPVYRRQFPGHVESVMLLLGDVVFCVWKHCVHVRSLPLVQVTSHSISDFGNVGTLIHDEYEPMSVEQVIERYYRPVTKVGSGTYWR